MREPMLERLVSTTLRWGISLSAFFGALGGVLYLYRYGYRIVSFAHFDGGASSFRSVPGTFKLLLFSSEGSQGDRSLAIVQFGILLLLLTPIVRVALSIVGFAREGDRTYVFITSVVLATLMLSVFLL